MQAQKIVLGSILAAIVGYFIVVPIYDIFSNTIHFNPLIMLGIGIILAVILVKWFGKMGSFVTLSMLVGAGVVLIVLGLVFTVQAVSWDTLNADAPSGADDGSGDVTDDESDSACCGSTAAVMAVATSWLGLVWTKRRSR